MKKLKIGDEFVGKESGLKAWVVAVGENDYEIAFERRVKGTIEKRQRTITTSGVTRVLRGYNAVKRGSGTNAS